MELDNFEQHAKEKFSNREITPSAQAWSRLAAMLSEQEKPKKNFNWWYVAASFAGLLLTGTLFFKQPKVINIKTPLQQVVIQSTKNNDSVVIEPSANTQNKKLVESPIVLVAHVSNNSNSTNKNTIQEVSINNQINTINNIVSSTVENNVANQVVATVSENVQVLPIGLHKNPKVQVDPASLLAQVDEELELSFREKVIVKVNKKYQTVKSALANRNNQE